MQFRCHECDGLIESHHTKYAHAKGYHPNDNPTASVEVAKEFDHCENCKTMRTYDPVAARTRDLSVSAGSMSPALVTMQATIDSLRAQLEAGKNERATAQNMQAQIEELQRELGIIVPAARNNPQDALKRAIAAHVQS
jgi:hypothetical protein